MKKHLPLLIIAIATVVLVISFFISQGVTRTQCDGIFEQTADRLNGSVKALKSEVSLSFGREKIQDLTEASQMVALRLKACCISHKTKAINNEQVMMCMDNTQKNEKKVADITKTIIAASEAYKKGDQTQASKKIDEASKAINDLKQNIGVPSQTPISLNPVVIENSEKINQPQTSSASKENLEDESNSKNKENVEKASRDQSNNRPKIKLDDLSSEITLGNGQKLSCISRTGPVRLKFRPFTNALAKIQIIDAAPVIVLNALEFAELKNIVQVFMFYRQCTRIVYFEQKDYLELQPVEEAYLDCVTIKALRNHKVIDENFVETLVEELDDYFSKVKLRSTIENEVNDLRSSQLKDCYKLKP